MICPRCGKPLIEESTEVWRSHKGNVRTTLYHCKECDYDYIFSVNLDNGKEIENQQYFFG